MIATLLIAAVLFNGAELKIETARSSAMPFNQVWPGYERPISQSRLDAFVQFDMARPGELTVDLPAGVGAGDVRVRPYSRKGWRVEKGRFVAAIERPEQFVVEFGAAKPMLHVFANAPFRYEHRKDEIYFGPGVHEAGLIEPKSGQTICIDAGATVYGAVMLDGVTNVTITGRGILDASKIRRVSTDGRYLRVLSPEEKKELKDVTLFMCRNSADIRVDGIVMRDSPFWIMIFRGDCRRVLIDNVKTVGQWRYNSDGIDICGCSDIALKNSFIRSFDDSFVVRDGRAANDGGTLSGISCENSILWCDWGYNFKAQLSGAPNALIEKVSVTDTVFANVQSGGIIIAARPGGKNGIIRDVTIENIEYDVAPARSLSVLQKSPDDVFVAKPTETLGLFSVHNYDLQNKDPKEIELLVDRLTFRNFTAIGDYKYVSAYIDIKAGRNEVRDFVCEGLPNIDRFAKHATFTTSR